MTNPTSNYGFVLPTATDLVTDLPADFDVALQGVDTRLKALQPGTTLGDLAYSSATANTNTRLGIGSNGQVLAVSGGVPAWTTTADVTPLTTKGDLFTFTTVDARLGVGANNTVLTADSAEATGLKWATVGGAPSWSLISTTNLTTGTTYSITGLSGYNQFLINVNSVTSTAQTTLTFTLNSVTTSSYVQTATAITSNPIEFAGSGSFTNTNLATVKSNPSTVPMSGSFLINGANNSGFKSVQTRLWANSSTLSDNLITLRNTIFTDTAVISSFQVSTSAGTFNAGSIAIYGSVI